MEPLSCACHRLGASNGFRQTEPPDLSELQSIKEERLESTSSDEARTTTTIRTKAQNIVLESQEHEERKNRSTNEANRSNSEDRSACCAALTMQASKRKESPSFQHNSSSNFSEDASPMQTTKQSANNFYISNFFLVLKILLFRLRGSEQVERWKNFRRKRPLIGSDKISGHGGNHIILYLRLTLFLLLLVRVFSSQTILLVASGQLMQVNQDREITSNTNDNKDSQQQERQEAFYHHEEPQPLVYMRELGSGNGYSRTPQPSSSAPYQDYESSSSVSPSLITAKCWNNNNDNDNDCKQINVITGPANGNEQQNAEDDSIITPVVIFESSSTLEPPTFGGGVGDSSGQPPALLAPPYSSSTLRPDANNVVLARHRTPPTANDIYAAQPAGATILPPATADHGSKSESSLPQLQRHQTTTTTITSRPPQSGLQGFRWQANSGQLQPINVSPDSGRALDEQQPVTRPTSSVFVATPRPKKPTKTTTMGRKCRDENDEDCDEPDEPTDNVVDSDNQPEGDDDDDNNSTMPKSKSSSLSPDEDEDADESGADRNKPSMAVGNLPGGRGGSNSGNNDDEDDRDDEEGSGEYSLDDNESGDSDSNEDDANSEPTQESTTSHVGVTPGNPYSITQLQRNHNAAAGHGGDSETRAPSNGNTNSSQQPSKQDAMIQVVVHPTLPPTFPVTTTVTPAPPDQGYQQTPDWSITSTMMPDDTYTSKPVFPSTTERDESQPGGSGETFGSSSNSGRGGSSDTDKMSSQSTSAVETTTQATDLATFTAIPMPPEMVGANRWPPFHRPTSVEPVDGNGGSAGQRADSGESNSNNNVVSEEHRVNLSDVTSNMPLAPKQFQAKPWREGKLGGSSINKAPGGLQINNPGSSDSWGSRGKTPSPSLMRPDSIVAINQTPRMQSEMLPTLLLYASIVILIVTAIIFAIMALALWRRNAARQRALLKTKLNGGPHQIVGSMSHGQLLANMARPHPHHQGQQQQPGLLSTYAPGKGSTMGKITTSVIKASNENLLDEAAEDEDDGRILIDHQSNGRLMKDSAQLDGSSLLDGQMANGAGDGGAGVHRHQQQRTSSWSTEEPTTSSGSQKTVDSQQQQQNQGNHQQIGQQQQHRPQYPNSLSDGRQNSSSISDQSQCSPVEGMQPQLQQQGVTSYQQQAPNLTNPAMYDPSGQHQQSSLQATQLYNQQAPVISDSVKRFNPSSRSVENLQQYQHNQGFIINNNNNGRPPYSEGVQQQQHLVNQQQQFYKPNGVPMQQPPFIGPQPMNNHYLIQQHQADGYPLPIVNGGRMGTENVNNNGLMRQQGGGSGLPDRLILNGAPVSPGRVAMNPIATLGRRYHPGMGLNRNIFSEDSSSIMTASPSLARTSSSSSFAFTTSQQQQALQGSIRAKPLVDAAGRVFNDYTQTIHNGNGAPPVLGRKDRSEAWYV